ncbi:hypothetical protein BC835DRAFT_1419662 [Cytidiella melzeri]|nr:hypothetical protein BC835DRAFT_1419662 [Cytidiella melzeri]
MASTSSSTPSLTPSRSPTPQPPTQPDHFYGNEDTHFTPSPNSDGRIWLSPEDDPLAQRGIPVFKPTMAEFQDFEGYMSSIECWGNKSGIVKIIPPKEWKDSLPSLNPQLARIKLKNPIEQQMMGRAGLFRQQNIERRKFMSVREWAELCAKDEMRAPGVGEMDLHARSTNGAAKAKPRRSGKRKARVAETADPEITPDVMVKEEQEDEEHEGVSVARVLEEANSNKSLTSPPETVVAPTTPVATTLALINAAELSPADSPDANLNFEPSEAPDVEFSASHTPAAEEEENDEEKLAIKGRRNGNSRQAREAALAERAAKDEVFMQTFNPHADWLPPNTNPEDYTPEFCKELERRFWRLCGLGKPAWYGADMAGSLFTDETTAWNVAHLPSALSRLLPASEKGLPGVNTPYLYFGMWRATFAWHVEDMDLFSINYIHFGAPKFWYAIPQGRSNALENIMRGYFPKEVSNCSQFLRHKSFLASPGVLAQSSCRPNCLVQQPGEFVVTFPRGYHAGFNLGFNCAESVNFALNSWLDMGRVAKACQCVDYSVRIDVDQLLRDREAEREAEETKAPPSKRPKKRKSDATTDHAPKAKKIRTKVNRAEVVMTTASPLPHSPSKAQANVTPRVQPKVTLKLGPKPKEPDVFPCCLCVSASRDGLLRVHEPPVWRMEADSGEGASGSGVWMAHAECANVVPETWVDEVEVGDDAGTREKVVMGVDAIVNGRWNLKCSACTKTRHKAHGAPIQCTKGKCPRAFHVSCARDGASHRIVYNVVREMEKEVVLIESQSQVAATPPALDCGPSSTAPTVGVGIEMRVDGSQPHASQPVQPTSEPQVLKLIKKLEVEVLCPQHNPAIAEAKKAAKQDKIRNELIVLPPMSRIKLRVSAGVFEVSLVRVIEEIQCVEVIWDRGLKREFKWGSVVFGNTETIVGQKPTEVAPPVPQPAPRVSQPAASTSSHAVAYTPPAQYYGQSQSTALASYHQPLTVQASQPQSVHYRPPYQPTPTFAPFPQRQPTPSYYNTSRPWTSYHYPHQQSQTTGAYSQKHQSASYYTTQQSSAARYEQRPGYTAMSYQPHISYQYASGASSYNQLAQQSAEQASSYRASPVPSASTPPSFPPSRSHSMQPSHPTPPPQAPPPIARPGSAAYSHVQPAAPLVQTQALQSLPPPSSVASQNQPPCHQPIMASLQGHVSPQPTAGASHYYAVSRPMTVEARFHVTTPESYVGPSDVQWQVPFSAP